VRLHKVYRTDQTVETTGEKNYTIFLWPDRRVGLNWWAATVKKGEPPNIASEELKLPCQQITLCSPECRVTDGDLKIELSCPTVGTSIAPFGRISGNHR